MVSAADPATFIRAMPKVELHAHLHGSIRDCTLQELLDRAHRSTTSPRPNPDPSAPQELALLRVPPGDERSLADCFALFDTIHAVVTSHDVVTRVTEEVIRDFDADNVCYIELRTTPRRDHGMTARSYLDAVLAGIAKCADLRIVVRVIVSINRSASLDVALDTVAVAGEYAAADKGGYVVGVDFSGNPHHASFEEFEPVFRLARNRYGLSTTVHTAEVPSKRETDSILAFASDRLGHVLHIDAAQRRRLTQEDGVAVPIEVCPTSNMRTLSLATLGDHPELGHWLRTGHPVAVSTDDSGVFSTTLSNEYLLVARSAGLSPQQVFALGRGALDCVFERDPEIVAALQRRFANFQVEWLPNTSARL